MRSSVVALLLVVLLAPVAGRAQTPPAPEAPGAEKPATEKGPASEKPPGEELSHRELAGHVFIPSHLVLTPFSQTSFGMSLAGGVGTANGPANPKYNPVAGMVTSSGTTSYPWTAVGPYLDLSVRLLEFLEMRLNILGLVFTGTSGTAALIVGSGLEVSGNLGLTAGLDLGEHVRAGLTFDVQNGPQYKLLVLAGIQEALKSGAVPNSSDLLSQTHVLTFVPGLVAAWAPWRFIGGTFNFQYQHPQQTGSSSYSLNGLTFAAVLDFDLMQLVREVPLGVTATYKLTAPIGSAGVSSSRDYIGGLFYTGRKDLALGLEVGQRVFRLQDAFASSVTLFYITTQYYW